MVVSAPDTKTKALCVATRCATVEQFVTTFHRFCDAESFFVATLNTRPVGLETPFAIQLADRTPVLRGLCVVLAAWSTPANAYNRPGIRLGIKRLTADSEPVFAQLQARRAAGVEEIAPEASEPISETPVPVALPHIPSMALKAPPPVAKRAPTVPHRTISVPVKVPTAETPVVAAPPPIAPAVPVPIAAGGDATTETVVDARTPGSELVLPANPLHSLTDESLEGFVDCTIYEETANFFRADAAADDDEAEASGPIAAPPPLAAAHESAPVFRAAVEAPRTPTPGRLRIDVTRVDEKAVVAYTPEPPPAVAPARAVAPEPPARPPVREPGAVPVIAAAAVRATPVPAGEQIVHIQWPPRTSRRGWWIAGVAALAAAALAIVIVRKEESPAAADPVRSAEAAVPVRDEPEPAAVVRDEPARAAPEVAVPAGAPPDDGADPRAAARDDEGDAGEEASEDAPPPSGMHVIGDGPCRLEVATTPAGTIVEVDGTKLGPSPIAIAGPCGKRRVELVHPRYKREARWVTIDATSPATLDVTLVRPTHALQVITSPAGATISIGGRRAGTSPTAVKLMGFSGIDIKIEKRGYQTVTKRIYSKKPQDRLVVPLKRTLFYK